MAGMAELVPQARFEQAGEACNACPTGGATRQGTDRIRLLQRFGKASEVAVVRATQHLQEEHPVGGEMDASVARRVDWDPYDFDLLRNPHDVFRELREHAPLYYNSRYDFYALSRYRDCVAGLSNRETFLNGRGVMLEQIRSGAPMPRGLLNFEDPPRHTIHRSLLTRVFTPRRMAELESQIRAFCARTLDPLVGLGRFDFVRDFSAKLPMRVIGMLLGIPEEDQDEVRERSDARLRTEAGKPMQYDGESLGRGFDAYIEERTARPSDDLMSQLIHTEIEDETGTRRKLTRQEVGTLIGFLASAGNETTNRLIGWAGKLLAEHPDQRREIRENRALIPQAVEEILRYEPPAAHIGRYVARDVELYGTSLPEGAVIIFLTGAANRDPREFTDPEDFDVQRERRAHLTFGYGPHVCVGNALARLEGRIALDEVLSRFLDWEVDLDGARMTSTSTVRGWETLPVVIP
jgi:cytochrome P450